MPEIIVLHPTKPHLLLIATEDGTISIWDLDRQTCLDRIVGHQQDIFVLTTILNPDRIISCGSDGSIKLWEFIDDILSEVYSIDFEKPYQDMEISGVKGLNRSQLSTLMQLGAINK
jgi:WD40 repeat protein